MELTLEYLAGFFDGEGSVGVYPNKVRRPSGVYTNYVLRVSVGQIRPAVLMYLKDRFCGTITFDERSKKIPNRQDSWRWEVNSRKALIFLLAIRPFLVVKAEEVDLAIEFQNQKLRPGHKYSDQKQSGMSDQGASYYERLKDMKRGVTVN